MAQATITIKVEFNEPVDAYNMKDSIREHIESGIFKAECKHIGMELSSTSIEFTRLKNDVNGNPRYACHFLNLLSTEEKDAPHEDIHHLSRLYQKAIKRANKIGGRKYHTRTYGGGIVFQSYSLKATEKDIKDIIEEETK